MSYLTHKFLFADIKDAVEQYATGNVLDIGCGNKPYESLFKNITGYTGTDIIQSSDQRVDVLCNSMDIPLQDGQYDTLFSTQVLEHVEDHLKMLQEGFRLLKSGGHIILTAPMAWEHHEVPYDFFRFTRYGLTYIFEKAGFEIKYIKANGGKWAFLGQMAQNVLASSLKNKKGVLRKILYIGYRYCYKYLLNIKYAILEKLDKDDAFITTNFIVVAIKP